MNLTLSISSFELYKRAGSTYSTGPCNENDWTWYPCDPEAVGSGQLAAHNWFDANISSVCGASERELEKAPTSMFWSSQNVPDTDPVLILSPMYQYCKTTDPGGYYDCGDNELQFSTNSFSYNISCGACCIEETGDTWVRYWGPMRISSSVVPNTDPLVDQNGAMIWIADTYVYYPNLQDVADYDLLPIPCNSYGNPVPIPDQPRGGWPMIYLGRFSTPEALEDAATRAAVGTYRSYDAINSGDTDCLEWYGLNISADVALA